MDGGVLDTSIFKMKPCSTQPTIQYLYFFQKATLSRDAVTMMLAMDFNIQRTPNNISYNKLL